MSEKSLVIVESPAKARTIARFLGDDFIVEASIGHIRDLPKRASEVPASFKDKKWAKDLGVNVDSNFEPLYVVDPDKKSHISKLKQQLKSVDQLLLATDEDREGESIAWHLVEVLKPKVPVKRMVFHEITQRAIQEAIANPRAVDQRLVDAQEARRILDRLYGYKVSPVLWRKIMRGLSAGRVQSVATRIVVEREQERMAFRAARYWDVEGTFATRASKPEEVVATLVGLDKQRIATGKDFGSDGKLQKEALILDETGAKQLCDGLKEAAGHVKSVERKPQKRSPAAPFMTSTLQQEASRKLRFASARTMRAAQRLYESGYITYMRTDSTTLSTQAIDAARGQIEELYGKEYLPPKPRTYAKKVKNAQEAHEAIRPAGDSFKTPEQVAKEVDHDEARLYELIWKRTLASQMVDSRGESISVRIEAKATDGRVAVFSVRGNTIIFPGFLRAYVEGSDDPAAELDNKEKHLPNLREGDVLDPRKFVPNSHETQPPARYTEASLVRKLEELGVGRPSTYASIMDTIQRRSYVWKKGAALVPSFRAFAVVTLLKRHFGALVDYAFTARMEDDLDSIASGEREAVPWLRNFYFGDSGAQGGKNGDEIRLRTGLLALVADQMDEIDAREINSLLLGQDDKGQDIVVRVGKYGAYLQRNEDERATLPEDMPPDELTIEKSVELLEKPSGDRNLGNDPDTGLPVFVRSGRFGAYAQLGEAGGDKEKPKTSSLLQAWKLEEVTLEQALKVLALPRTVGVDPSDEKTISAQLGRYGPYISKEGGDSRSLENEDQVFTVTVEEALKLFAEPKRRGRRAAAPPLKELGEDPDSKKPIVVKNGRFGPYVTDGETNASLRKGDSVDDITLERARELLEDRRQRAPVKKAKKKASKKKKTTKKATAKKAAKKATTKKAAKKKTTKKAAKKTGAKKKATAKKAASKKAAAKDGAASTASGGSDTASTPPPG